MIKLQRSLWTIVCLLMVATSAAYGANHCENLLAKGTKSNYKACQKQLDHFLQQVRQDMKMIETTLKKKT